jgi:hypothetical protein
MGFIERVKYAWLAFRHPYKVEMDQLWVKRVTFLKHLLADDMVNPVRKAVDKVNTDTLIEHEARRRDAFEWVGHYSEHRADWDSWKTRFLIEWVVGEHKGFL